jgi:hypothetical protein
LKDSAMTFQHHIDASFDTLFKQATDNAAEFTRAAIRETERLPEGVDRTAVIVAFINAAASDWRASALAIGCQKIEAALDDLGLQVGELADE